MSRQNKKEPNAFDRLVAVLLILAGVLFLLQFATKPLLWFAGSRAPGYVSSSESSVSSRPALWTHYTFSVPGKGRFDGNAMVSTGGAGYAAAAHLRMEVAYLPWWPEVNMPAYGGYTAGVGMGWLLAGIAALSAGKALYRSGRKRE